MSQYLKHRQTPHCLPSSLGSEDLSVLAIGASAYKKHFTASAVVLEQAHILLVHHKRIGAWLPPGGHIEEHELPHQTAIREVKEETGVDIAITSENLPATERPDAFFLPSPLCIHAVKALEGDIVYHIDLAYLCRPFFKSTNKADFLPAIIINEEVREARWVKLDHLSDLPLANNVIEIIDLAKSRLKLT